MELQENSRLMEEFIRNNPLSGTKTSACEICFSYTLLVSTLL